MSMEEMQGLEERVRYLERIVESIPDGESTDSEAPTLYIDASQGGCNVQTGEVDGIVRFTFVDCEEDAGIVERYEAHMEGYFDVSALRLTFVTVTSRTIADCSGAGAGNVADAGGIESSIILSAGSSTTIISSNGVVVSCNTDISGSFLNFQNEVSGRTNDSFMATYTTGVQT